MHFLDAVPDRARAEAELDVLRDRIPDDGVIAVESGIEGETRRRPGDRAAPRTTPAAACSRRPSPTRELDELAAAQQDDGGWDFPWAAWNPAVAWEWRGMVTLIALDRLRANGRL